VCSSDLDPNTNRDKNSNGMGLYISRRIMGCLNGSMEVKSKPGIKTEFKIYFEAQKIELDPNVSELILTKDVEK
jgi:signal transduction histidine kinase